MKKNNSSIWRLIEKKWYLFVPTSIFVIVCSVLKVAEGHMMAELIDTMVKQNREDFLPAVFITLLVFGGSVLSIFLWKYLATQFSDRLIAFLQRAVSKRIAHATDYTMHQNHSGDLLSRMSNDLNLLQEMLQKDLFALIGGIATAVFALFYLFYNNWLLTIVVLASLPVIIIFSVLLSTPVEKYANAAQKSLSDINKQAKESVAGAEIIRAFNMQTFFMNRFRNLQAQWSIHTFKRIKQEILLTVFGLTISFLPFLVVFGFGGYLVLQGQITIGLLFAFIQLLNYISFPLQELPMLLGKVKAGLAGGKRLLKLLNLELEREDGHQGKMDQEELIRFENVYFSYPGQTEWALKDVSFTIKRGERIAVVGSSGCGKSTLFKLILGEYAPQKGTITLGNTLAQEWNLKALRKEIAVVVQEPFLMNTSIKENIQLGNLDGYDEQINTAISQAQVSSFLNQLPMGINTSAGELGARFSGGQRQRVCVARALMKKAPMILMDEATSALDNETESLIIETVKRLPIEKTIIMIAHRIKPLHFMDRFLVLDHGTIAEEGSHESLLSQKGRYTDLYNSQSLEEGC